MVTAPRLHITFGSDSSQAQTESTRSAMLREQVLKA
jgi:hypothetical protein